MSKTISITLEPKTNPNSNRKKKGKSNYPKKKDKPER
jgi:hypothetical protein